MSKTNNLTDFLTDTANAIRAKKGYSGTRKINPQNFSSEIASIQTGITGFLVSGSVPSGDLIVESDYETMATIFVQVEYIQNGAVKSAQLNTPGTKLSIPKDGSALNSPCQVIYISGSPEIVQNEGSYSISVGGFWVTIDQANGYYQVIRKDNYIWIF